METPAERVENKVNCILRMPVIRHIRAIYELLIMVFRRNYFDKGVYVNPHEKEIEMIYDIWSGKEKKRRYYIGSLTYRT